MADISVPVKRLRLSPVTGTLVESKPSPLFLKGPVPLDWISAAAKLPGKALAVGIALWWLEGMSKGAEVKVTKTALNALNVSRDAFYDGLKRLEEANLITVIRKPGKRPLVRIVRKSPEKTAAHGVLRAMKKSPVCRPPTQGVNPCQKHHI